VDDWAADHTVYIYGFDKSLTSLEDDTDGKSPMLINGEAATVVTPTDSDADPDAADESALKFGNHDDEANTEKKFYYAVDKVYDFVGFYTGKEETVTPAGLNLTADVTIDGSNDVMLAAANPTADVTKANINMKTDRVYSAFAARRNVHPTLNFTHMLTRFSFYVVRGETPNTSTMKTVNVTKVATTTTNKGTLNIAPIASQKFEKTANSTAELSVKGIAEGGQTPSTSKEKLGEDIMIFPGDEEVTFKVSLVPTDQESDPNLSGIVLDPMEVTLDASEITGVTDATFEAGKKYTVVLTVYGLEQVQVSASLTEWGEIPEWTYDPDDEYADQITVSEIKVKNESDEDVTLYHNALTVKVGVKLFTDKDLKTPATAGTYTSDTHTITVGDGGAITEYTEITPAP